MARYEYRCPADGLFEVTLPLGTARAQLDCPRCGTAAPRRYSAPRLALARRDLVAAIDRAERSRTEPEVVSAPAGRRRRRPAPDAALNPAVTRLPRP